MSQLYLSPECEEITVRLEGVIATSGEFNMPGTIPGQIW